MTAAVIVVIAFLAAGWYVLAPLLKPSERSGAESSYNDARTRRTEALGAILELEDDLSMGKLTEEDFTDLKARYETEAVDALRAERRAQADEDALEAEIESAKRRL